MAVELNGTDQYYHNSAAPQPTGTVTIGIIARGWDTANNERLIGLESQDFEDFLYLDQDTGVWEVDHKRANKATKTIDLTDPPLDETKWHVFVFDALVDGEITLRIVEFGSASITAQASDLNTWAGGPQLATAAIQVGARSNDTGGSPARLFGGEVAEAWILIGDTLTDQQVIDLGDGTTVITDIKAGVDHYWTLETFSDPETDTAGANDLDNFGGGTTTTHPVGGATSVTPTETSQAQASETPALTQIHDLTASDSAQAQTSETPAATIRHPVSPSETAQAHASETPGITQIHGLTASETSQAQVSETPAATVSHPVSPSETSQTQTSEAPALSQIHALTATETAQAQASDTPAITVTGTVQPSDTSQAHTSDTLYMVAEPELLADRTTLPAGNDIVLDVDETNAGFRVDYYVDAVLQTSRTHDQEGVGTGYQATIATTEPDVYAYTAKKVVLATGLESAASNEVVITVEAVLEPSATTQSQTSETPAITQVHKLTATETTQSQASETPAITQIHDLAPTETAQTQVSETPTISVQGQLVPNDTAQSQASETPALTQVHDVQPAETTQAQASENPTLGTVHSVTPSSTTQAHVSETPAAVVRHAISPASTIQAQTAETPTLAQVHALIATATAQAQTSETPVLSVAGSQLFGSGTPAAALAVTGAPAAAL